MVRHAMHMRCWSHATSRDALEAVGMAGALKRMDSKLLRPPIDDSFLHFTVQVSSRSRCKLARLGTPVQVHPGRHAPGVLYG